MDLLKKQEIKHRVDLYHLLPDNPICVECGVAEGLFAKDILSWGVKKLYLVDAWRTLDIRGDGGFPQKWHDQNYHAAMNRVAGFDNVEVLRGSTTEMAPSVQDNSVHFVNVDASHDYESVKADIAAWWPKLRGGGIMAFHDYESPDWGVKQAVQEFATANGLEIHPLPEDKPEDAGAYLVKPKKIRKTQKAEKSED